MTKKLTGIEIYKLLPRTNCGDCQFSTCMAFAMQVAAKKVSLDQCPHVSAEAKAVLGEAQAPPMRTVTIGTGDQAWTVGGETVLFRHEEKFHRPCAIAVRFSDDLRPEELSRQVKEASGLKFFRIGQEIKVNLIALEHRSGDFAAAVAAARESTNLPLVLICADPATAAKALKICGDGRPLLYPATSANLAAMAALAKEYSCPMGVCGSGAAELAQLTTKLKELGVEDLILDPGLEELPRLHGELVRLRRLALRKTFRPLGYPTLAIVQGNDPFTIAAETTLYICKYASIVILPPLGPEVLLPLLTVRQNIYTDPRVPLAIEAKLYEVGNPGPDSPVLVTTNFALTYFLVEGEVERSKVPAYIAVVDTGGLGVLNSYADDRFTAEKIVKTLKEYGVMDKVRHKKIIIPGLVAVLKMEIEEGSGWEVIVGPEDAAGIPSFLKTEWNRN